MLCICTTTKHEIVLFALYLSSAVYLIRSIVPSSSHQVSRGESTLPRGRLYLSFNVWTPELLAQQQKSKAEAEESAMKYEVEKKEELQKYQSENNILMKAWHYRNAVAAVEKIDLSGAQYYRHVPGDGAADSDDVRIHDGLLASNRGAIFNINADLLQTKTQIGEAFIVPQTKAAFDLDSNLRP